MLHVMMHTLFFALQMICHEAQHASDAVQLVILVVCAVGGPVNKKRYTVKSEVSCYRFIVSCRI